MPPPETYEHAVGVGKKVTVVALDYDRCAKMLNDGWQAHQPHFGMAPRNSVALAGLLYGMDRNRLNSHMRFVSFSNRQSDKINTEYFGDEPRVNLEHLDEAVEILHGYARLENTDVPTTADKRYFLDQEKMGRFPDKATFKAYVKAERKQELAAMIRAAYPDAANFVFVDDDWESLPQPVVDKVYVVHFAPLIQDPNTVKFNENDVFLFGSETQGLPKNALSSKHCLGVLRVPMAERSRSINLANTVSIVLYEALRQLNYPGLS